jgi:hypothetical protein
VEAGWPPESVWTQWRRRGYLCLTGIHTARVEKSTKVKAAKRAENQI